MCTIGSVINAETGTRYFFKNVDQTDRFHYVDPVVRSGDVYSYLKLPSGSSADRPGVWAGVNEAGVVVLGADGNCMPNYSGKSYSSLNESLVAYEDILSRCGDTTEAMNFLMQRYQSKNVGGNGDIILIGDRNEAIAMEYSPNRWGVQFQNQEPYIVRSNFFVLLDSLRPRTEENTLHTSSALRYSSALKHLSVKGTENTLDDIFRLVKSHDYGMSAMSICRHGGKKEYFTHCCLVVELTSDSIKAHVMVNDYPCEGKFRTYQI